MTWATVPGADPIAAPRRLIAELAHLVAQATRAMSRSSARRQSPKPRHYPPQREAFLEQAAMTREMLRL
ncbi:MAG: hypothetical protein ACJ74F_03185 [Mycobacterium sp.]|uniref:hypothetical protein n=1 Tax=Mycobacterium sp. TaxID=1785 RepID=UPI00389AF4F2